MKAIQIQNGIENEQCKFDAGTNIFSNLDGHGFGYVIPPVSRAGQIARHILCHLFRMDYVPGSIVQIATISSPNISEKLRDWSRLPEETDPLWIEQRENRVAFALCQGLRDSNILITYSSPNNKMKKLSDDVSRLTSIRNYIESAFLRTGTKYLELTPNLGLALHPFVQNNVDQICLGFRSPDNYKEVKDAPNLASLKCGFIYTQTFCFRGHDEMRDKALRKYIQSSALPFIPSILGRKDDWKHLLDGAMNGDVILGHSCNLTLPKDAKDDIENAKMEMVLAGYTHHSTSVAIESTITNPSQNRNVYKTIDYILKSRAIAVADIHGDSKGNGVSGMLLKTRGNQLAFFNNFNSYSNYNIAIAASAGSGMWINLAEFLVSKAAMGSKCFIVDSDGCFKGLTCLLQGEYCVVKKDSGINPFSTVTNGASNNPHSLVESLSRVSTFIMFLADLNDKTGYQEVRKSVDAVWDKTGNSATVGEVVSHLLRGNEYSCYIASRLFEYGPEGRYADSFTTDSKSFLPTTSIAFNIDSLRNDKKLFQANLLSIVLRYVSSLEAGEFGDRSIFVFPDAWEHFNISEPGADLIEGLYRKIRLYGGAAVTTTSRISDYCTYPLARRIFEQSHWKMIFRQRRGELTDIQIQQALNADAQFLAKVDDLRVIPGQYAEVAIIGGGVTDIYQLELDPFSRKLYEQIFRPSFDDVGKSQ